MAVVGCGSDPHQTAVVSGRITLDGQPLGLCQIRFQPQSVSKDDVEPGSGSFAVTDDQGRFSLTIINPVRPGAMIGTHQVWLTTVTVAKMAMEGGQMTAEKVPRQYRSGKVTFVVLPEGTDKADFELTSSSATR